MQFISACQYNMQCGYLKAVLAHHGPSFVEMIVNIYECLEIASRDFFCEDV